MHFSFWHILIPANELNIQASEDEKQTRHAESIQKHKSEHAVQVLESFYIHFMQFELLFLFSNLTGPQRIQVL